MLSSEAIAERNGIDIQIPGQSKWLACISPHFVFVYM